MTDSRERSNAFRELVDEFCSGIITDERLEELEALLLADESARREFVAYFHLHTEIHFAARAARAVDSALRRIDESTSPRLPDRRRRSAAGRRWAAAAAVLLLGISTWWWLNTGAKPEKGAPPPLAQRGLLAPTPSAKPAFLPTSPTVGVDDGLAMVVRLEGVRWETDERTHPAEGDLLGPGRIRVRSGRVTLSMLSGAVLIVEGPADLDLVAIDRVFCRQGRLRTRVPKDAEGLVISSPSSAVIDLGTEFGLNVDAGGKSHLKVFEGKAEAVLRTGAGNENLTQFLGASTTVEIDSKAGKIRSVPGGESFVPPLDLPMPALELDPGYPAAVHASRPWGYWRFQSLENGEVPNEVSGRPVLRARGSIRLTEARQGENRCASYGTGELNQFLEMNGSWQPTSGDCYAVELWFLPGAIEHASLVSMTAPEHTNHHVFFLEMTSRNRHAVHPPASVRFLDRWPPGTGGGHNIYSSKPYVPFRWHHLVGQMNGGRMELYLDGQRVRSTSADHGHPTQPCQVIVGRLSTVSAKRTDDSRWLYGRAFPGQLDEVALYDRPLTIEEIREHHRLGARRPEPASKGVPEAPPSAPRGPTVAEPTKGKRAPTEPGSPGTNHRGS